MPKFTIIQGSAHVPTAPPADIAIESHVAAEVLSMVRDFLNINDPAVQQAVLDIVAALARLQL